MEKEQHSASPLDIPVSPMAELIERMEREAFEKFVVAPPFEYSTERMTELSAWPGNYRSIAVQLAWESWKAKRLATYQDPGWVVLWPDKGGTHMRRLDRNGNFTGPDAALIAAAPELLAAAMKVNALSIQTDAHKELRAAIANATGDDDAAPECTCAAKDMTFGRCCKVTPNA